MAYESELEAELEDEFEAELEDEGEDELEGEDFLGDILGEGEGEDFLGDILGESEGFLGDILGEGEDEFEGEDEYEGENPVRKIYPDAMMEHLGELAAEAESEEEAAEHFLPLIGMAASKLLPVVGRALAPLARKALPKIARAVTKASPHLTKGIGRVAKVLHRNAQARHLLRAVPGIARRTVGNIAHRVARGGSVTPRIAMRTLAKQTRRVLGTPLHRKQALRRHNHLERNFHRMGHGMARPHMRHGYGRHYRGRGWGWRGGVAPGRTLHGGATGVHRGLGAPGGYGVGRGVRYGRTVGGQCSCPSCGTAGGAAPAYCRCCGQAIQ